jgi:hypothetical protein
MRTEQVRLRIAQACLLEEHTAIGVAYKNGSHRSETVMLRQG